MPPMHTQLIGNRYQLQSELGAGGMGVVYRALDRLTGETVALKRVLIGQGGAGSGVRLALAREFRTLASLRHPHIISVLDYGFDADGQPYFAMPLLEQAHDLRASAQSRDEFERVRLFIQVLMALAYLHRRGIVHRDLKPANVLVTAQAGVKVLDFGLAVEPDKAMEVSGTLLYMAPEILQMQGATPRSDLYAVGMMAYEVFAHLHPLHSDDMAELIQNILFKEPNMLLIPELDVGDNAPSLRAIVERLLDKDPYNRYGDAYEVVNDLSRAIAQATPIESPAIRESFLQAAKFVGRSHELDTLLSAFKAAQSNQGSAWWVTGESGVGKSRLLDEVRVQALVNGALVLRGQEVAEASAPFVLWREPLRRLILAVELDDLHASILREIVPDIAQILGREVPPAPELDGSAARQRLTLAIADLFAHVKQPIVLLLEDLHWSQESLEPISALLRLIEELPLLLIATYRSEEADLASRFPSMHTLHLERLSEGDVSELARSMLGDNAAQARVVSLLHRESEGNAYFIVETVRTLAEELGGLNKVLTDTLPTQVMAGGVEQVVRRRLSRVPAPYRPALNWAAVAGREIDTALMTSLMGAELDEWLTTCANVSVLVNWDGRWRFAHDKLREVLLRDLPPAESMAIYQQVAVALEQTYPADPNTYAQLADLWRSAGDSAKETYYAIGAGERLLATGGFSEALALFQRAHAHLEQDPAAIALRLRVLKFLGDAYESLSQYAEAVHYYQASLELALHLDDKQGQAWAYDGLGDLEVNRGNLALAHGYYEQSLGLARTLNDASLIAESLTGLGTIAAKRGESPSAEDLFQESLALWRSLDNSRRIAAILNNLGILRRFAGNLHEAEAYYQQALSIRRAIGDRRGMANTLSNLGVVTKLTEGYEVAAKYYDEAIAIFRAIGDLRGVATLLNNRGILDLEQRAFETAERAFQEAVELTHSIGDLRTYAYARDTLGQLAILRQDYASAQAHCEASIARHRQNGDRRGVAMSLANLGYALREQNLIEQAQSALEEAQHLYADMGDRLGLVGVYHNLGANSLYRDDLVTARQHFAQALNQARQTDATPYVLYALSGYAALFVLANQLDLAARLLSFIQQHDIEILTARAFLAQLEVRIGRKLARATLEISRQAGATLSLDEALALLEA